MGFRWSEVIFENLDFDSYERLIVELSEERDDAKFNYYYDKLKDEIYRSKNVKTEGKKRLETFIVSIKTKRFEPKNFGVDLLEPTILFANEYMGSNKDLTKLLQKMGTDEIVKVRNCCAKFCNTFTNESICIMTLNYCKDIIMGDIEREGINGHLGQDLSVCKAVIRGLVTSKVATEELAIQMIKKLESYVELYSR